MADEPVVERPEWLPEKFQSPEDLAKSYAEAEAEMGRLRSQFDAERQQFASVVESLQTQQQVQQPVNTQQQFDPALAAYAQAYETGDIGAMLRIQAEQAGAAVIPAVSKLLDDKLSAMQPAIDAQQAHVRESSIRMAEDLVTRQLGPDKYKELLPEIRNILVDNPGYLPQSASVEGYAASILAVARQAEQPLLEKRVQELEAERAEKLAAQAISGGGNRSIYTEDQQKAEFERIKAVPTGSFAEVMRGRSAT